MRTDIVTDNGGPAGVLYELLVACFYYAFIAACIAEVRIGSHSSKYSKDSN